MKITSETRFVPYIAPGSFGPLWDDLGRVVGFAYRPWIRKDVIWQVGMLHEGG